MLRKIILWRLGAAERELGASVDYLRHILRVSLPAFFRFAKAVPLSSYRRKLPADACFVAKVVATRDADCGPCVQIEVNLARQAGVPSDVLQATLDDDFDALGEDLANVHRFTTAVVEATYDEDPLRERIVARYGEAGLVELAIAIGACRVFPVTKRALGYAKSCARTTVRATG